MAIYNCSKPLDRCEDTFLSAVKYVSLGAVLTVALGIIFYSFFTHYFMDKLLSDPAMAMLTKERFFTFLKIGGLIAGVTTITGIYAKCRQDW